MQVNDQNNTSLSYINFNECLPDELIIYILKYLPNLKNSSLVCKNWAAISGELRRREIAKILNISDFDKASIHKKISELKKKILEADVHPKTSNPFFCVEEVGMQEEAIIEGNKACLTLIKGTGQIPKESGKLYDKLDNNEESKKLKNEWNQLIIETIKRGDLDFAVEILKITKDSKSFYWTKFQNEQLEIIMKQYFKNGQFDKLKEIYEYHHTFGKSFGKNLTVSEIQYLSISHIASLFGKEKDFDLQEKAVEKLCCMKIDLSNLVSQGFPEKEKQVSEFIKSLIINNKIEKAQEYYLKYNPQFEELEKLIEQKEKITAKYAHQLVTLYVQLGQFEKAKNLHMKYQKKLKYFLDDATKAALNSHS